MKAIDPSHRDSAITLYRLVREDGIRHVEESIHFRPVTSYVINVIVGEYREAIKRLDL